MSTPDTKTPDKLRSLSDIYRFFRNTTTPIYFVSPTAYNILGLGQWIQGFQYISHFDSFDGGHFRVTNVEKNTEREFRSMEDMLNYLLSHKDRKSTRLNSSHITISYAVFCLKKKKRNETAPMQQLDGHRPHRPKPGHG